MAKRPTRLRFTEDDLADSHVKKAADRADKAVDRAEKAADKLASKKAKPKLKLETDAAGSRKAKLRFEKAEFTEIERPSVAKHMASRGAAVTLTSKAHRAVSEYEDDNIGVQAVQETTKAVESTVYTVDHAVYSHKLKAYDKAEKLVEKSDKANVNALYTPRKKIVTQAETQKVNLLVDIQAKLQAGKGAGYARWAKVFNLKQMAQTMNYLSEHNLLEYAVLEEKAAAATAHHNELSAQIKAAEKRMAEIAVLRTHIVNYAKTREVYVDYRKAGYSKKFREEHEEEILLHQAAKNAFDEMGVKKLPKVKELQTEYAKLLEEKKKTYAEYRRSREEMRELLTAKANVDRVLKMEVEQDVEKEKDHGQR